MSQPYDHPALRHLQITFTTAEYEALIAKYTHILFTPQESILEYWGRLPRYLIARCPLCGASYTSLLDTHSLLSGWHTDSSFYNMVFGGYPRYQHVGCEHFVAVQTFVNFNGHIPTEVRYLQSAFDVPFVMPTFLPDDVRSYAVFHSLPICRIEGDTFVPRYTAYMITYYAANSPLIWERRMAANRMEFSDDMLHAPIVYTTAEATGYTDAFNLPAWIARGKLHWLDPRTEDLVLRTGSADEFPYPPVTGYGRPFTLRDGVIIPGY